MSVYTHTHTQAPGHKRSRHLTPPRGSTRHLTWTLLRMDGPSTPELLGLGCVTAHGRIDSAGMRLPTTWQSCRDGRADRPTTAGAGWRLIEAAGGTCTPWQVAACVLQRTQTCHHKTNTTDLNDGWEPYITTGDIKGHNRLSAETQPPPCDTRHIRTGPIPVGGVVKVSPAKGKHASTTGSSRSYLDNNPAANAHQTRLAATQAGHSTPTQSASHCAVNGTPSPKGIGVHACGRT